MSSEIEKLRGSLGNVKDVTVELLKEHTAEALRECGVLWLVFSLLDQTLAGDLTFPWILWNLCGSIVFWAVGLYIETKRKR
jgi:hypothetical protein